MFENYKALNLPYNCVNLYVIRCYKESHHHFRNSTIVYKSIRKKTKKSITYYLDLPSVLLQCILFRPKLVYFNMEIWDDLQHLKNLIMHKKVLLNACSTIQDET